jgi:hypothetical protein
MKIHNLAFLLLFQFSFAFDQALKFPQSSSLPDRKQQKRETAGAENIIFRSADGGQTWQDISEGLPENLPEDGILRDGLFANDNGIYLRALEMGYIKVNPIPRLLFGKMRFSLTHKAALSLERPEYLPTITVASFYKK